MKVTKKIETIEDIQFELINREKESPYKQTHYVNNKELYQEFVDFNIKKQEALDKGLPVPKMSDKIGRAIIQIANRRCNSRQYVGYSNNWKEELILNAIMTAAIRCHGFDPEKSNNPFAYLTQICDNAIKEQIKREKKQLYVKYKSIEETNGFHGEVDDNVNEADFAHEMTGLPVEKRQEFIQQYEDSNLNKDPRIELDTDQDDDQGILDFC